MTASGSANAADSANTRSRRIPWMTYSHTSANGDRGSNR